MVAQQELTAYERKRLENIRRNDQMMASLNVISKASELSSTFRTEIKSHKPKIKKKKKKKKAPVVIRQSLRKRGVTPDFANGIEDDSSDERKVTVKKTPVKPPPPPALPITTKDAYKGDISDRALLETINRVLKKSQMGFVMKWCSNDVKLKCLGDDLDGDVLKNVVKSEGDRVIGSVDLRSFSLELENVARVMPERVLSVKFFPCVDMNMIIAGDALGHVAFWDVDSGNVEGDGIYLYHPHSGMVSWISVQPFALSKIYTSCQGGFVRLMDVEKEMFDLLYHSDEGIYCLSQHPSNTNCLYFGEGHGGLNLWDERAGRSSSSWLLHDNRINSIDFSPENSNIIATSSSDGTARIWDLRRNGADMSKTLRTLHHNGAVMMRRLVC